MIMVMETAAVIQVIKECLCVCMTECVCVCVCVRLSLSFWKPKLIKKQGLETWSRFRTTVGGAVPSITKICPVN